MSAVHTTGTLPQLLREGIEGFVGTAYKNMPQLWTDIYKEMSSDRAYEERVELSGLGYAPAKPEGEAIDYGKLDQGGTSRIVHTTYGYGIVITEEAQEDNQYVQATQFRSEAIGKAMANTKNSVAMLPFNRAFSTSFNRYDGVPLISAAHPLSDGASVASNLTTGALSEATLETMLIKAQNTVQHDGTPMIVNPKCLVVPIDLKFAATRILESELQSGVDNNNINAIKLMGSVPKMITNRFLTDTDAFFLVTDVDGAVYYNRRPLRVTNDNDFDTSNLRMKATERYSFVFHDWRAIHGSAGA